MNFWKEIILTLGLGVTLLTAVQAEERASPLVAAVVPTFKPQRKSPVPFSVFIQDPEYGQFIDHTILYTCFSGGGAIAGSFCQPIFAPLGGALLAPTLLAVGLWWRQKPRPHSPVLTDPLRLRQERSRQRLLSVWRGLSFLLPVSWVSLLCLDWGIKKVRDPHKEFIPFEGPLWKGMFFVTPFILFLPWGAALRRWSSYKAQLKLAES